MLISKCICKHKDKCLLPKKSGIDIIRTFTYFVLIFIVWFIRFQMNDFSQSKELFRFMEDNSSLHIKESGLKALTYLNSEKTLDVNYREKRGFDIPKIVPVNSY